MNIDRSRQREYEDMIGLPRPESRTHTRMSRLNRAAQFAPFAALTGYGDAIKETARLTGQRTELDENSKEMLDEKLRLIQEQSHAHPVIRVTCFLPDDKKEGGEYVTVTGRFKKIDTSQRLLVLTDNTKIKIGDIKELTLV